MRLRLLALLTAVGSGMGLSGVLAEPNVVEKGCIFEAAKKLPVVQGLVILASSTRPMPPALLARPENQNMPPSVTQMIVSLDIQAAAVTATFEFMCGTSARGTAVVPIGITK
jgi:hypothetical protein